MPIAKKTVQNEWKEAAELHRVKFLRDALPAVDQPSLLGASVSHSTLTEVYSAMIVRQWPKFSTSGGNFSGDCLRLQ